MRLLVAGGRDWGDTQAIYDVLDKIHHHEGIDVIIEGHARCVDRIAGYWARRNKIEDLKLRANWDAYGRAAGPIRNQRMIDEGKPDMALIFPGGRGTQDMRRRLEKAEIMRFEPIPLVDLDQPEARAHG